MRGAALSAWVRAGRSELPEVLASSSSKPHAKLARRALYALRSCGLKVAPVASAGLAPVETAAEAFPAVLSLILGTGERAIFFVRPVRGGGLDVYQGLLSDERGLLELEAGTAKRSSYRARIKELQADPSLKVLLVPWERMQLELGRALTLNERSLTRPSAEATELVRKLDVVPADPDWEVPPPLESDQALVETNGLLHAEPELHQWLPSAPALAELTVKLAGLSAPATSEQTLACAQQVAAGYLTPVRRKIYARRLWLMAELLAKNGREPAAERARAEARHLFHSERPSRFIEAMFECVLAERG